MINNFHYFGYNNNLLLLNFLLKRKTNLNVNKLFLT